MKRDKSTAKTGKPDRKLYIYLGDKNTGAEYKNAICEAVFSANGKCIRGRNGAMLVSFKGRKVVVLGRRLRKQNQVIELAK